MKEEKYSRIELWLLAIRPKTLPAAVGPVAVGSAVAYGEGLFMLLPMLGCLIGSMLLQIAVNLANDYFDFKNKIDSDKRLGPRRVTQSGLISPDHVKRGMILCLLLAGFVFLYLSLVGGWPIVCIGILSVLAALAYSGGPFPLASNGLGEIFVFIFFGLIAVGGTYFIQTGHLTSRVICAAIPPGLLITAIMVVNNLRDIDTDKPAGKKTLAVMLGRKNTIFEYRLLLVISYLVSFIFFMAGFNALILLPFLTLPLAWKCGQKVGGEQGKALNELLAGTAKLSLFYSLLFSIGLAYGI